MDDDYESIGVISEQEIGCIRERNRNIHPHGLTPQERFCLSIAFNGPPAANRPELGPCWLWLRLLNGAGYGSVTLEDGRRMLAHRFGFFAVGGVLGPREILDHFACDRPDCVNPHHVRPATHRENLLRGNTISARGRAKLKCPRDHSYDETNTYVTKNGTRKCRRCEAARQRRLRATKRSER